MERPSLHVDVAPALDAYELKRLVIVAGCVATAATANYAGTNLPQPALVAVGSAALGILLMLRRRPPAPVEHAQELVDDEEAPPPRRFRAGRAAHTELLAMTAAMSAAERRLEEHEARLVSLSGRQSLLQVDAREKLADLLVRLQQVEARIAELEEQTRQIGAHQIDLLKQLNASLAEHREALAGLVGSD